MLKSRISILCVSICRAELAFTAFVAGPGICLDKQAYVRKNVLAKEFGMYCAAKGYVDASKIAFGVFVYEQCFERRGIIVFKGRKR